MNTTRALVFLFLAVVPLGCAGTVYHETISPSGDVPPVGTVPPAPPSAGSYSPPVAGEVYRDAPTAPVAARQESAGSSDTPSRATLSAGAIQRFREAYRKQKQPRMAIFLNRVLSDEVREWRVNSQSVVAMNQTETLTTTGNKQTRLETTGGVAASSQTHIETEGRPSPDEQWMWAFEDGFLEPLLQANCTVVDRATIMRLNAANNGKQGSVFAPIAVKEVEMNALLDKADIFVEILIARSPKALYGYEFRATAKEVRTGAIVGSVTSLRWRPETRTQREVVATDRGYEVQQTVEIPTLTEVSADLSVDLMNALASKWGG